MHLLRVQRRLAIQTAGGSKPCYGGLQLAEVALDRVLVQQGLRGAAQLALEPAVALRVARLQGRSCFHLVREKHAEQTLVLADLVRVRRGMRYDSFYEGFSFSLV